MKFILPLVLVLFTTVAKAELTINYVGKLTTVGKTILSGGTSTGMIDLGGFTLTGISFPAAMTGTSVTFQTAESLAGTALNLYDSSGQISITIAAGRHYAIDPLKFQGLRYLNVVSGSTEGANRDLVLHVKGLQ